MKDDFKEFNNYFSLSLNRCKQCNQIIGFGCTLCNQCKEVKLKRSYEMKVEICYDWYSKMLCDANKNKLYIFGDNAKRYGNGGQAMIRLCQNSYGIATKWGPSMKEEDFFTDDPKCFQIIEQDINQLIEYLKGSEYIDTVVFPAAGLGTGLAELDKRAHKTFKKMNDMLCAVFHLDNINDANNEITINLIKG